MADKKSFIMYTEWKNVFEKLPAEKAGILIQAVFAFESGEEVSFDDPMMDAMFSLIQPRLEENDKKYEAQVE
ncbi:MAG: DUF6291 domain-containing protein, partial [Eubacteriales bacterium]|nr:DUF6291 domain-containing protein [Eubacteriales bacterium]